MDEIVVEPGVATSRWTCESPALPTAVRERDRYTVADGRIVRLEVEILDDDRAAA